MNYWEQKNLFQLNTLVQRWSFHRIYEIKNIVFLSQKVDGNMIFTDYWKVLVLNFSVMGNTVFFWVKKLMERWYLLVTEKFLFWTFRRWEIRSLFESRSSWKDDIYWLLRSSCFELFGDGKYGLFSAKKLMERWYLLGLFELSMIFQDLRNTVFRAVIILCRCFIIAYYSSYCYILQMQCIRA